MNKLKKFTEKYSWLNLNVIATVLIIKALVLVFAAQSYQAVTDHPIDQANWFLSLFSHWDADSYLKIAQFGYASSGEGSFRIVFFPLYPALIAVFQVIFRNYIVSALFVSGVASLMLGLTFRELVKFDYSERTAQYAVLFLFVFPTSFVLHIPYTESLFLALTVGCFLAARKRIWLAAGILGALACLTRVNGLILLPALAFEIWEEYRDTRKINWSWLFLTLIPMGFGVYIAINYFVTGDPVKFLFYQRENFGRHFELPWAGLKGAYDRMFTSKPTEAQMNGVQEMTFVIIGLFATVVGWRYLRKSYCVWMALNWLLFVSTSYILSVPRYTLIMFPMFILMAKAAKNWGGLDKNTIYYLVNTVFSPVPDTVR